MDGAWEIMELHFWDENVGLYKVQYKYNSDIEQYQDGITLV